MSINLRCLICGKNTLINKEYKDYKKILESNTNIFICEACGNKVRYESDLKQRKKKPI